MQATIDEQALRELTDQAFVPFVIGQHGDAGGRAIRSLMSALWSLQKVVDASACQSSIIVFQEVDNKGGHGLTGNPVSVLAYSDLNNYVRDGFALEIDSSGSTRMWERESVDVQELSISCVVYEYQKGAEYFHADGKTRQVPNLYQGSQSAFGYPTFEDLREALLHYRGNQILTSMCPEFSQVWTGPNRLFFVAKPEERMRRSLERYLRIALRGNADARPEQIVDESHPVDIRVTYQLSKRVALIEVKWLGKSKIDGKISTIFGPVRARDGAEQLAGYLDSEHGYAPDMILKGYLVVIDGRRWGLKKESTEVSTSKGFYFRDREITYEPRYHEDRDDFQEPIRMFAEPICT